MSLPKRINPLDGCKSVKLHLMKLKQALIGPDIMAFPTGDDLYILDCDTDNASIGCVLSQTQSNVEKVIAYGSQTLGKSERNYCTTD